MKRFKITYHENGVTKYLYIYADNKADAENRAWGIVDADDIYVSEAEDDD